MSALLVRSNSASSDRVTVLLHTRDLVRARERLREEFLKMQGFGYQMENSGIDEFVARSIYNSKSFTRYYILHIGDPI